MHYRVTISKSAIKILEKVNEPYYSQLKRAIYNLAINPRPIGYKKFTGRNGYRIEFLTIVLFMKYKTMFLL